MPSQLASCNNLRCIDFVTANRTAFGFQAFFCNVHQLQKREILGEKCSPSAVYATPATSRFLNRGIRRHKLPMNFLHRSFCAQNHFSHTESLHDANLAVRSSYPYRPAGPVSTHSHEIVINGQPTSSICTDETVPVLGT